MKEPFSFCVERLYTCSDTQGAGLPVRVYGGKVMTQGGRGEAPGSSLIGEGTCRDLAVRSGNSVHPCGRPDEVLTKSVADVRTMLRFLSRLLHFQTWHRLDQVCGWCPDHTWVFIKAPSLPELTPFWPSLCLMSGPYLGFYQDFISSPCLDF